jgi:hypothetical protein
MNDTLQANSAVDAIRCAYLARMAEQKGHLEAAQRWQRMATRWLDQFQRHTRPEKCQCVVSSSTRSIEGESCETLHE